MSYKLTSILGTTRTIEHLALVLIILDVSKGPKYLGPVGTRKVGQIYENLGSQRSILALGKKIGVYEAV